VLRVRLVTAFFLFTLVGYFLYFASVEAWKIFVVASSFIAAWEWAGFAKLTGHLKKAVYSSIVMAASWVATYWFPEGLLFILTLFVAVMMLFFVVQYQRSKGVGVYHSPLLTLVLGFIALLIFFQALVQFRLDFSANVLLLSFLVVWMLDTGAYLVGRRFGKVKLAIYVSPGKTWEGAYGGVVVAFVIAWGGLNWLSPDLSIPYFLMAILMALIAGYSILGDLFESLLKRQAGLKDSGNIFPGHGGMLDRVDSMIIAAPMYYFLWQWVSN